MTDGIVISKNLFVFYDKSKTPIHYFINHFAFFASIL